MKLEQIIKQMNMYDHYEPHEDIKPQNEMDSSMAYYLISNENKTTKTAVQSMYQKGKGQIAKPGDWR